MKTFVTKFRTSETQSKRQFFSVRISKQIFKSCSAILFTAILLTYANLSFAQVATPSLDSILLINMPAATGWRYSSTAGLSVIRGQGTEQLNTSNEIEISWSELSYLISSHVTGPFYTEGFRAFERREKNDKGSNESEKYEIERTQLNFAFRMDDSYSLGLSYFSSENTLESDSVDTFYNEVKEEQIGIGAGVSVRFSEQLYFAFGLEYIDEKSTSQSQGNEVVDSNWVNQLYGLAFMDRNQEDPEFRVELSRIVTPEVSSSDTNSSAPIHFASVDYRLSIEFMLKNFETLLRFEREDYTESQSNSNTVERIYDSYGIIKTSRKGWNIGLYLITGKETTSFSYSSSTTNSETANTTYYRANLAYNF